MSANKYMMDMSNRKPRPNLAVIIAVFMLCLMGSILLHGWSQSNSVVPALQVLLGTAQGPSGIVISQDEVTVYVPPNATDRQGTIFLAAADPDVTLVSNDTQWIRPKVVSVEYRRPDGSPISDIVFSSPLELCFGLNQEQWKSFSALPDAFQVQYYKEDVNPPRWEVLPRTSYPERLQVCGETTHLSVFALAVKVDANVPITGPTLQESTAVPTRTPVPVQTQERNRKKDPTPAAVQPVATNAQPNQPQPTSVPPTLEPTNTKVPQPTNTPRPTATNPPAATNTPRPTHTPRPTATNPPAATNTPRPTNTPQPTATNAPPTATNVPPTNPPPTATDVPPTQQPPTQEPTQQPTDPPPPPTDVPPPTEPPTAEPTPATILDLIEWFISPSSS